MSQPWQVRSEALERGRVRRFAVESDKTPLTFGEAITLWQTNKAFREFFLATLAAAPFDAFRWETPPVTSATCDRAFEFVILDSPGLARAADDREFAEHFSKAESEESVLAFPNLRGDATLVVPCPRGPHDAYGHLASFVRSAPIEQRHALWQIVGQTMDRLIGPRPLWLSTAGAGVAWLHVRFDTTPKYYGYGPYRVANG